MARRTRLAAVVTLAMINVFTLAAGITVARMLPSTARRPQGPHRRGRPGQPGRPGARRRRRHRQAPDRQRPAVGPGRPAVRVRARTPGVGRGDRPRHRPDPLVAEPGPALDARLHHQAGHLRRRARRARPGRHVHHQGGARRQRQKQRHPGRRRRSHPRGAPVPGRRVPPPGHAGQPGRQTARSAQGPGPPHRQPRLRRRPLHRPRPRARLAGRLRQHRQRHPDLRPRGGPGPADHRGRTRGR